MNIWKQRMAIRVFSALLRLITRITLYLDRRVVRTTQKILYLFVVVVIARFMGRVLRIARIRLEKALS